MKKNLFILCVVFAMALISCNNNEPEGMPVQDGKVSFTIPAPSITANGSNQIGARKVTGKLEERSIDFTWDKNDEITFTFYDANRNLISTKKYTVETGGSIISVSVDAPNNAQYATAATGPETIVPEQLYGVNAMHKDHMRFETDGLIELQPGENYLQMYPIWTALIITPTYTYYFDNVEEYVDELYGDDDDIDADELKKHITTHLYMEEITVTQTIGSNVLEVKLINQTKKGKKPLELSANNGITPRTPYIIVVNPAEACDLAIDLKYLQQDFKGESDDEWDEDWGDPFSLTVNTDRTTIETISMHTEEQSVTGLLKGNAYDIEPMKDHPAVIHWLVESAE